MLPHKMLPGQRAEIAVLGRQLGLAAAAARGFQANRVVAAVAGAFCQRAWGLIPLRMPQEVVVIRA